MGECRGCRWWDTTDAPQLIGQDAPSVGACRLLETGQLRVCEVRDYVVVGARIPRWLPWATFGCNQWAPQEPT